MPGVGVQVSLAEAIEVRGSRLDEVEIWSILRESSASLLSLASKDYFSENGQPKYSVTPETLMLVVNGKIKFTPLSLDVVGNKDLVPPEYSPTASFSNDSIQKMCVFSLGLVAYWAADYALGEDDELSLSAPLDALLGVMCEEDCLLRASLDNVIEACRQHSGLHTGQHSCPYYIVQLYKLVLGSNRELSVDSLDHSGDDSPLLNNGKRHGRSGHHGDGQRSGSKERHSSTLPRKERPLPVGRDQQDSASDGRSHHHALFSHTSDVKATSSLPRQTHSKPLMFSSFLNVEPSVKLGATPPPSGRGGLAASHGTGVGRGVEELHDTYQRLLERRRKLEALRRGLDVEQLDSSDRSSLYGDEGADTHPLVSTPHTGGQIHSDPCQASAPSTLGRNRDMTVKSLANEDTDMWIARQQHEIEAMRRAQAEFVSSDPLHVPSEMRRTYSPLNTSDQQTADSKQLGHHTPSPRHHTSSPRHHTSSPRHHTSSPRHHTSSPQNQPPSHPPHHSNPHNVSDPLRPVIVGQLASAVPPSESKQPVPNKLPRKFFGPEFVVNNRVLRVSLPQTKGVAASNLRPLTVILLDGNKLDVVYDLSSTVHDLFSAVISVTSLHEPHFFGLCLFHDDEFLFLGDEAKLSKIAPAGQKSDKHGSSVPFKVFLKVKFYVDNLMELRTEEGRHMFYLQLRQDVLRERCHTTEEQGLRLAALALQAEYGDWWDKASKTNPEYYLAPNVVQLLGLRASQDMLPPRHHQHCGLSDKEAEMEFIKEIQQLPEYGIHFYKVFKSKKDISHPVWTGVSLRGVLMADNVGDRRVVYKRHPWHMTQKISFSRHRFSIKPKAQAGSLKLTKFNYHTESYRKGQYLLQLCKDHHRFDMDRTLQGMESQALAEEIGEDEEAADEEWMVGTEEEEEKMIQEFPVHSSKMEVIEGLIVHEVPVAVEPCATVIPEVTPTPSRSSQMGHVDDDDDEIVDSFEDYSDDEFTPRSGLGVSAAKGSEVQHAYVLGESIRSHDVTLFPPDNDTLSESLAQRLSNLSSLDESTERHVFVVELEKVAEVGIGITIVGGDNVGKLDLGVFVSAVVPDSPADLDGRIMPGDRIIAINGHSVEGFPHQRAVELIRDSPRTVQLLLSQSVNMSERPADLLSGRSSPSINELTVEHSMIAPRGHTPSPNNSLAAELQGTTVMQPQHPSPITSEGRRSSTPIHHSADNSKSSLNNTVNSQWDTSMPDDDLPDVSAIDSQLAAHRPPAGRTTGLIPGDQYEVMLQKHNDSLGLNVTGGVSTSVKLGGIYVKSLAAGGPAEAHGGILVGDRVIEVNEVSLVGVTHRLAVETLRSAPYVCKLLMERGVPPSLSHQQSVSMETACHPSPSPPASPGSVSDEERFMDALTDNTYEVDLKQGSGGLGLNIVGGANTDPDPMRCVLRVKQVLAGGAAAVNGSISSGDVLLEINDDSVLGLTHLEALELLRAAGDWVHLTLSRPHPSFLPPLSPHKTQFSMVSEAQTGDLHQGTAVDSASLTSSYFSELDRLRQESGDSHFELTTDNESQQYGFSLLPEHEREGTPSPVQYFTRDAGIELSQSSDSREEYEVVLTKGRQGLGFSIAGGPDTTGHFYIKSLLHDPAKSCPRLREGDHLIKVDQVEMGGVSHLDAVMILRNAPDTVTLRFSRPRSHQSSEEDDLTDTDVNPVLPHDSQEEDNDVHVDLGVVSMASSFGEVTLPLSGVSQHRLDQVDTSGVFHAELKKPPDGSSLGLSLMQAEKGISTVLYISSIVPGGVAHCDGRLQEGDRLIQINKETVVGMPHNKAIAMIKQSKSTVSLTVSRAVSKEIQSGLPLSHLNDTDSEVDSETLDDLALANTTPPPPSSPNAHRSKALTPIASALELAEDITPRLSRHPVSDDSEEETEWQETGSSEEEGGYEISQPPAKPPRKTSQSSSNLPRVVTQDWLDSLPLLDPPQSSVHYTGRHLLAALRHLETQLDSDDPSDEFKNLKYAKLTDNCIAARLQENKSKNRYRNVVPYDANRVLLSGPHDYINASYVRYHIGHQRLHYIASQGPLPNTDLDFWQMVVEQKACVVAMLTQEKEAGKVKCHQYWPVSVAQPLIFSDRYEVKLVKKQHLDSVSISSLRVCDLHTGVSHPVLHLNLTTWPDQTAPASAAPILQFVRLMHLAKGSDPGPIVVHCSAGIGRTGALLTLDVALCQVHYDLQVDVKKIVQDLRRQRQGMIQTKDQYTFCYRALHQALLSLVPPGQLLQSED